MTNQNTKFTVIIPTRERPDTLLWALKTCVSQDYENLEIIVSDNFSQDNTREVVESYHDSRIKYINPGKRLGMSTHWEFALEHVTGEYVNFIGDDDGMMPRAFTRINEIINEFQCEGLGWDMTSFVYHWPNLNEKRLRDLLRIRLSNNQLKYLDRSDIDKLLQDVKSSLTTYRDLPYIYSGTFSINKIREIISTSGRFFNSMTPDIYSGIVFGLELDTCVMSDTPYSIGGTSSHSNGYSQLSPLFEKSTSKLQEQPTIKFLQENSIPFHEELEYVPVIPILIAECILQSRDHLVSARNLSINMTNLINISIKSIQHMSSDKWLSCVSGIRTIGEKHNIVNTVEKAILKYPNIPNSPVNQMIHRFDSISKIGYINCSEFSVKNVYEASILLDHILTMDDKKYLSNSVQLIKSIKDLFLRVISKSSKILNN
jgi:hypothetical protein